MNVCHSLFETFNYVPKSGENCGEHKLPSCSFKNVALGEKATNVSCPGVTAYCKLQYLTKVLVSVHLKKLKKIGYPSIPIFKLLYEYGLWYQKKDYYDSLPSPFLDYYNLHLNCVIGRSISFIEIQHTRFIITCISRRNIG